MQKRIFSFIFLLYCGVSLAQNVEEVKDSIDPYKPTYSLLPVVYFLPETSLGFGVGGISTFRFRKDSITTNPSQFQIGLSYTLLDQILLFAGYRTFWDNEKYLSYGELGYYRYIYNFYGVGPNTPIEQEELYDLTYPRIRISVLQESSPNLYLGLRYWFDAFNITRVGSGGLLDTQPILGNRGGRAAGFGPVLNYDSRDDQFYPAQGYFIEGVALPHTKVFASEFEFLKLSLDVANYQKVGKNQILALNFYGESNVGEVPFYQMALLGGTKRLRGLYEGRFRDNNSVVLQAEYRWKFYKRFGLTVFYGAGNVFNLPSDLSLSLTKHTYGGGLRFQLTKKEKVNLRLDVGLSPQGSANFYVTFGEAF